MDEINLFILKELKEDAKRSAREIAESCRSQKGQYTTALKRCAKNGTIRRTTIDIDPEKGGSASRL